MRIWQKASIDCEWEYAMADPMAHHRAFISKEQSHCDYTPENSWLDTQTDGLEKVTTF